MQWKTLSLAKGVARGPHQPRNHPLVCEAAPWVERSGPPLKDSFLRTLSLPFLVSKRHQHLASAASSDGDFVTPEPRRTTQRHPDTRQRVSKKKPRIVFSSDESSEEGTMLPPGLGPEGA